jgi:hypothetical protein
MKYLILAFLTFILSTGFAQNSEELNDYFDYQLYFNLSCEKEIAKVEKYYINTFINDTLRVFYSDSNGVCRIPKNDTLELNIHASYGTNKIVGITNQNDLIDTITIPPIYNAPLNKTFTIGPTYYGWYNCGQICHGKYKTYRQSGDIWQKGKFKNGKLKRLTVYDTNGQIESKTKDGVVISYGILLYKSEKLKLKYKRVFFFESYRFYDSESDRYIRKNKYLKSQ